MSGSSLRAGTRAMILDLIAAIAPEADTASLSETADMREELDLDSIDFTNLVISIHQRTGIDIPERDYHHFFSLGGAVEYVKSHGSTGRGA